MDDKQLERIRKRRKAVKEGDIAAEAPKSLDSGAAQHEIMEPTPRIVKLQDGTEYPIYPLRARLGRAFTAWAVGVFSDTGSQAGPPTSEFLGGLRLVASLGQYHAEKLFVYVAFATGEPNKVSDEDAAKIARELDERANLTDVSMLFKTMMDVNDVMKVLQAKN